MDVSLAVIRVLTKALLSALTAGTMEVVMIKWEDAKEKRKEKQSEKDSNE